MPITPFHFGPGAAVHATAPRHVSFLAFCAANVLMDFEPLYYMITRQFPLHRFFHTYVGATLIWIATVAIFRLAHLLRLPDAFDWQRLRFSQLALGAALGSYSHIIFDSIMHADIRPFAPFSTANPLFHIIPVGTLHLICVACGVAGLTAIVIRNSMNPRDPA